MRNNVLQINYVALLLGIVWDIYYVIPLIVFCVYIKCIVLLCICIVLNNSSLLSYYS